MKKISLAKEIRWAFLLLCGACCCVFAGCEDNREEYLDGYQTRFYFRNNGVQPLTLFKVGKNTVYEIPICKTGYNQGGTGKVTVSVMDQEQLDIYNLTNLTNYIQLPSDLNLFKFLTEREFYFESDDTYKVAVVELDTDKISELQESDPQSEYILALQVHTDGENTLSPDVNMLFISPNVDIVRCSLSTSGVASHFFYPSNLSPQDFFNSLRVNFDNDDWDFSYGLGVYDQEWLDAYNEANGTSYTLLPSDWCPGGIPERVAFAKGKSTSEEFKITVDPAKMELLKDYLLPIYVKDDCSKEEFKVNEAQAEYLLNVRLDPDKVELTADMASSPYTHTGDGQGIPALFDGKVAEDSYWHSKYSTNDPIGDPTYGYYIDIALAEPLSAVVFKYATRANANAVPAEILIGVSNDGETWTALGDPISSGLPTDGLQWASLPARSHTESFTHVRFGVVRSAGGAGGDLTVKTGNCVALSELELYGANLIDAN